MRTGVDPSDLDVSYAPNSLLLELPDGWYLYPPLDDVDAFANAEAALAMQRQRTSSVRGRVGVRVRVGVRIRVRGNVRVRVENRGRVGVGSRCPPAEPHLIAGMYHQTRPIITLTADLASSALTLLQCESRS